MTAGPGDGRAEDKRQLPGFLSGLPDAQHTGCLYVLGVGKRTGQGKGPQVGKRTGQGRGRRRMGGEELHALKKRPWQQGCPMTGAYTWAPSQTLHSNPRLPASSCLSRAGPWASLATASSSVTCREGVRRDYPEAYWSVDASVVIYTPDSSLVHGTW